MSSKNVNGRRKSTRMVNAAIREHSDRILAAASSTFERAFAAAVVMFLEAVARYLDHVTEELRTADEALYRERDEDSDARSNRDDAVAHLRSQLITLSEDVRYMYGPSAPKELSLSRTPEEPEALERYARVVLSKLPGWTPAGAPRIEGYTWDGKSRAEAMSAAIDRLDSAMKFLAAEAKQTDEGLTVRDARLDRHTSVFNLAASVTSQVLTMFGEAELARRIRPSSRRPGYTQAVLEEEDPTAMDETEAVA